MDGSFETDDPAPADDFDGTGQEFVLGPRTKARHGGSVLMAAMIGLAEALGMDPEPTEIAQPASSANGPNLDLNFGGLPPLDEI